MLASFLSGEFLLEIPCWLHFDVGSFPYTSRAVLISMQGVSLTHPVLASLFIYFYLRSFSYTSRAGFIFIWGVSLTHPVLASFLSAEFLLYIPWWLHFYLGSFSYTSRAGFYLYLGSFSYISHAGFVFIYGVSLTNPVLASLLSVEFP